MLPDKLMLDSSRRSRCRRATSLERRACAGTPTERAERGLTVVELLVATLLTGVGVMAVAGLFLVSARSTSVVERQADATDIATGEIEVIRSLPYDEVGIAVSAPGYQPEVDGRPTVTESGRNLVVPTGTTSRGGVEFEIFRSVTWITAGSSDRSYKLVLIEVGWASDAGPRTVALQTGLYEGASP